MNEPTSSSPTFYDSAQDPRWLDSKGANRFIDVVVNITYWVCKFGLRPMRKSCFIGIMPSDLRSGSKYVIASNHQSVIDPFLICSQIPFLVWQRIVTLRFFLANYIFDKKVIRPLAISLGCFPAKPHSDYPSGLDFAIQQLNAGRSVLIFPEGRRTVRGDTPIRYGVQVLAREPGVMIIPMHVEWSRGKWGRRFAFGIGKPFDGSNLSPDDIMERVYATPVK